MLFSSLNPFSLNNIKAREMEIRPQAERLDGLDSISNMFSCARNPQDKVYMRRPGPPAQNLIDFVSRLPKPTETCPGVCVAERLSGFCEAILNVDDLCKSNLRCCVSKETYDNDDSPGGALFIPNGSKPPPPVKRKTTKRPKVNKRKQPPKRNTGDRDDCKGTCVTGFFALLCEDIDKSVECPGLQICNFY